MFCDHCGERYREVWKSGRLRPLLYSNNQAHACPGSLRERGLAIREAKKSGHGGNWRKKMREQHNKRPREKSKRWIEPKGPRWTVEDKANREADTRLAHLLEAV